jgi:hypothetical protein
MQARYIPTVGRLLANDAARQRAIQVKSRIQYRSPSGPRPARD